MIDWDKPIQTMRGQPARVVCRDFKGDHPFLVVASISIASDAEVVWCVQRDGTHDREPLVRNVPVKVTKYINLYKTCSGGVYFSSESTARSAAEGAHDYIKTVKVEWEE